VTTNAYDEALGATPMDRLELIDKGNAGASHPVPLLFVHGGAHAAWCWDEFFLDYFAAKGFRAVAMSLRGHGASLTSTPLAKASITDYVDDLSSVIDHLSVAPVLIGHSLGGFIVQKYLESHDAPGAILLASAPPQGLFGFMVRSARRHPWLMAKATLTGNSLQMINTATRAREAFFSADAAEPDVARWASRFQEESPRALLETMLRHRVKPGLVSTPLLVLGAGLDRSITTKEVHATATAYGTEAEVFAAMGHDMMLEPRWPAVAERIYTWLASRSL
jgi:pimeloyl-ACP methyl ester carboxylesterase